ncbi:peptidase S8, partial [Kibdelosporangium lantanae]
MRWKYVLAASSLLVAVVGPAAADPLPPNSPTSRHVVTLVTGDRVTVLDGRMVSVTPGEGRQDMRFLKQMTGGRITVIPVDALPLVETGRVDRKLFDVTGLIRLGYDTRPDIPLIVTYQDGVHQL